MRTTRFSFQKKILTNGPFIVCVIESSFFIITIIPIYVRVFRFLLGYHYNSKAFFIFLNFSICHFCLLELQLFKFVIIHINRYALSNSILIFINVYLNILNRNLTFFDLCAAI